MKQNKLYEKLNNLLMIFLVLQPVLDVYMALVGNAFDIFGISIATLIRTIFVITIFAIVVISQIKYKYHTKYAYAILGYLGAVILYSLLHHINIVSFNGYFITEGMYSFLTEILYVLRLIIPVFLIYVVIITKPSKEDLFKVIIAVVAFISFVIIITNIFEVSYASYSQTNGRIEYNVIDWFVKDDLTYDKTLSKGYFVSANQIGALLVFLLPMTIYYTVRESKWYLYIIMLLQVVSMVLVGTRVANYGWILVFTAMIVMYTVLYFTKSYKLKLQNIIGLCIVLIVAVVLYTHSPSHTRSFASEYEGMYDEEMVEIDQAQYLSVEEFRKILADETKFKKYTKGLEGDLVTSAKSKYISEMYKYHYITNKYILEIYPYQDDLDFWLEIFNMPIAIKGDNRGRQVAIIKRIKHNNDNLLLDTLFGMGATPLNSRGYMIENDLISHYYNLGIIGIILFISPFLLGIVYSLYRCRKHLFDIINMEFAVYVLAIVMTYFTGYFAGHVIDEYIISIYLGVVAGIVTNFYRGEKIDEKTKT